MDTPALAKITPPRLSRVLPRKRLSRRIHQHTSRPISWIVGPPGAGKTTAVASYIDDHKPQTVWYQVDAGDADVATFFHYMGQAAKRAAPRKRKALPVLTPERWLQLGLFAKQYFRELYGRLKPPFVIVFDNYQEAPDYSRFHEVVCEGLSEMPEGGRAIVVSRSEPPAPYARLRARQSIDLVEQESLAFTQAEVGGLLRLSGQKKNLAPVSSTGVRPDVGLGRGHCVAGRRFADCSRQARRQVREQPRHGNAGDCL